jgi:hypothetical protein
MKICVLFFVFSLYNCLLGKAYSQPKLDNIIINKNLNNSLFDDNRVVVTDGAKVSVIKDVKTGKSDTIGPVHIREESDNCDIQDIGRKHYGFDHCMAFTYFTNDTLVLQFQNKNIELPKFEAWDRLVIRIIGNKFYAEYVYTNKSPYQLMVTGQELVLQRWTKKRGEQIKGKLLVRCDNALGGGKIPKSLTFNGYFNTKIE